MQSAIPKAHQLGNRRLYETLFDGVLVPAAAVSEVAVKDFCISVQYFVGSQIDGALDILECVNAIRREAGMIVPSFEFVSSTSLERFGTEISVRLLNLLAESDEFETVFPPGSLSWRANQSELLVQVSRIPIAFLPVVRLFRELGVLADSGEGVVLLRASGDFAVELKKLSSTILRSRHKRRLFSPTDLAELKRAQAIQGERAEEFVLQFERLRLSGHPNLEQVRRVSINDTSAGYDIESFEDIRSFFPDRFIEVKSYDKVERFYLSTGELEVAEDLADHYYLYIVHAERIQDAHYSPTMLRNPAGSLFSNSSAWSAQPDSFLFTKK